MIELKPIPYNSFTCPECGASEPLVNEFRFESINVLADCTCSVCAFEFYQALPVGHTVNTPLAIGKLNKKLYESSNRAVWLSDALLKAHLSYRTNPVVIRKITNAKFDKVVILNTLDSLYGHVLLKLYNALYHLDKQKDIGLVLIIPKLFEWLIPKGCAEVWVVELKLSELVYGYDAIQKFVANESLRFREIYLSSAFSHPDFTTIDIARLTGVAPFSLEKFSKRQPTITFVLREDRWWFTSTIDYWFYRISRKLKVLPWASAQLSMRQNRLIKRTITQIKRTLPSVTFYIVGLGKTGRFVGYASDERKWSVNAAVEKAWCDTYAHSHVVVGIHGSNMLLPTALAAGCVEILPEDRYGNMVQDISVRYHNRLQLFFYRFADQFASPKSVAAKVVSMILDYESYQKRMSENTYPAKVPMTTLLPVDDYRH
jgi:hypothetical protein